MRFNKEILVAECVSNGHPDRMSDIIAEKIRDAYITKNQDARVGIEVMMVDTNIIIGGETNCLDSVKKSEILDIVNSVIINYGQKELSDYNIDIKINGQSQEINDKVESDELGAGDQGIIYGYATTYFENKLFPLETFIARKVIDLIAAESKTSAKFLGNDGKCYVVLNPRTKELTVNVNWQHEQNTLDKTIDCITTLLNDKLPQYLNNDIVIKEINVNSTGDFVVGGSIGDTGLTGRKLAVDTYGGTIANGGGALAGKDNSKVDRSASHYAQDIAKKSLNQYILDENLNVENNFIECLTTFVFQIGEKTPMFVSVDIYNNGELVKNQILDVNEHSIQNIFEYATLLDKARMFETNKYAIQ